MIQTFIQDKACQIILNYPLKKEDTQTLKGVLQHDYSHYRLEFGRIYMIDSEMLHLLYREIHEKKQDITIITHKQKLHRYLHKLGFKSSFESLIQDEKVALSGVDIVLIGGSANSSKKIIEIVQNILLDELTLVIVQHIQPNIIAKFNLVLQPLTQSKVSYAKQGEKLQKNHIYICPNNRHLKVKEACFILDNTEKYNNARPSISVSYDSFSHYYKEKLLVIQECGYAEDGVDKLQLLYANKTKIILQDSSECEAKSMIESAQNMDIKYGYYKIEDIILYLIVIGSNKNTDEWIGFLLEKIYVKYKYDFRLYNRDMILRRVNAFKITHSIQNTQEMVATILLNKSAFKAFFLDISINVTEFFRNPLSYEHIQTLLYKSFRHSYSIKLWSAGCSNGKESYSLAILLKSMDMLEKSIIYATDFNSVVINEAKNGIYSKKAYNKASKNMQSLHVDDSLAKYVIQNDNYVTMVEEIKNKTQFFEHNLVTDGSFNEFDIIICKNVIIYFNDDLQKKIFALFYDSLKFGGYLVLGQSEIIHPSYEKKFESSLDGCKIYKKVV